MDSLKQQYEQLTDEEKNALILYKTTLGKLMNDLDNNPDFELYYNKFLKILNNPLNNEIKNKYFSELNFESLDTFINSIINIKKTLDEVTTKLVTDKYMKLYRMVTANGVINDISKDNIVSTSLSPNEVFQYGSGGKNIYLFEIGLPAESHIGLVTTRIKYNEKENLLYISRNQDEEEIILNKDIYEFEENNRVSDDDINYITCIAKDTLNKTRI